MEEKSTVLVTGNTYPVRGGLHALGGTWDANAKGWRVPTAREGEARKLVADAPKSAPRRWAGRSRHYVRPHRRCEDAPCCGCCD